ncbi:ABC transporter permease subunit [uncultured Jatrophihabitans sp.]|uniref:ABC transporter permease subunit n=1 Tax=uncultured Jatrophihabitans sp. TaxID=1610747 RepID=UPI0035CA20D1
MADAPATASVAVRPSAPRAPSTRPTPTAAGLGLRTLAVLYVGLLVLVPVAVLCYKAFEPGLGAFFDVLEDPDTQHAFQVTVVVAASAVVINTVLGIGLGILLARYRFPGKRLLDALVDLPIAVSPIVVGLALLLVYGPSGWFASVVGTDFASAKPGLILATAFVSLPLVVRAVVPVLAQAGLEQEQAAASLGANALVRFRRITLPAIRVALSYGIVLCIARCVGEYGAVLVLSNGGIAGENETAATRVGNYIDADQDLPSAYAVAFVLMLIAIAAILVAALIRRRGRTT